MNQTQNQSQVDQVGLFDSAGRRIFLGTQEEFEQYQTEMAEMSHRIGMLQEAARYTPKERAWVDFMSGLSTDAFRSAPEGPGFDPTINKAEAFRCPQPKVYERAIRLLREYDPQYQEILRPARARIEAALAELKEMGINE